MTFYFVSRFRNDIKIFLSVSNILLAIGATISLVGLIENLFEAWHLGDEFLQFALINRYFGPYWFIDGCVLFCSILLPLAFWFKKIREKIWSSIIMVVVRCLCFIYYFIPIDNSFSSTPGWHTTIISYPSYLEVLAYVIVLTIVFIFIKKRIRRKVSHDIS